MEYIYTVWLRNLSVNSDDPDYEWPACFIINGKNEQSSKEWGDHLSKKYADANNTLFLNSQIECKENSTLPGINLLPNIMEFEEDSNDKIGW